VALNLKIFKIFLIILFVMDTDIDYRYLNGKIYKLVCNKEDLIYIGSTIETLNTRLSKHKCSKNTCISRRIIDNGDYEIILLELYPCMCRRELEQREQEWMEQFDCINLHRSYMTEEQHEEYKKQYYQKYNQNGKEYFKNYRENNREKISEKFKCECGGKYTRQNKSQHFKSKKHKAYLNNQI